MRKILEKKILSLATLFLMAASLLTACGGGVLLRAT
jgi:hypothetical protein